jgi:predicted membrane metal-binding protein
MHENLERREKIKGSSDLSIGLVIAAGFALVALLPLWRSPHQPRWWALGLAIAFALFALLWPKRLAVLNRLWLRFGLLLSVVVSPIILGLLFYTTLLPIGLLMRVSGKDPLRLQPDRAGGSYWIRRDSSSAATDSMKHQF